MYKICIFPWTRARCGNISGRFCIKGEWLVSAAQIGSLQGFLSLIQSQQRLKSLKNGPSDTSCSCSGCYNDNGVELEYRPSAKR